MSTSFITISGRKTSHIPECGNLDIFQQRSIGFYVTYSLIEIESWVDPGNRFFKLINAKQTNPGSSRLGICIDSDVSELVNLIQTESFLKKLPGGIIFA